MPSEFLAQLNALISAKRMKLKDFATRISLDPSYLSKVLRGEKPLPQDRIIPMADAFGLKGDSRTRFLDDAHISICPPYVQKRLVDLRKYEAEDRKRSR
jgi:transcriptional regulator with XRE-family HTH domain